MKVGLRSSFSTTCSVPQVRLSGPVAFFSGTMIARPLRSSPLIPFGWPMILNSSQATELPVTFPTVVTPDVVSVVP